MRVTSRGNEYSEKGVLLVESSIESTVLFHLLARADLLEAVVFVNYGQASVLQQQAQISKVAARYNVLVERRTVALEPDEKGGELRAIIAAAAYVHGLDLSTVYLPFYAEKAERAAWGALGYGDTERCPAALRTLNELLDVSGIYGTNAVAPFLDAGMGLQDIASIGAAALIDVNEVHPCYHYPACGVCHRCTIRASLSSRKVVLR